MSDSASFMIVPMTIQYADYQIYKVGHSDSTTMDEDGMNGS